MNKHAVFNTELINYHNPVQAVTIKLPEDGIELGNVLKLGKLIDGERQVYQAEKVTADTSLDELVFVTQLKVPSESSAQFLSDYVGKKDQLVTGWRPAKNEIFAGTKECFTGDPKQSVVELQADYKLNVVATATTGTTKIGEMLDYKNGMYAFVINGAKA